MAAVRQARCAVLASSVCASKSSDAAGLVMSLAQLPPAEEAMRSAAGAASLSSLMVRVAEVLADMSAAVGEAAEHAMSTAVAVAEMERQAAVVKALAAQADLPISPHISIYLHISPHVSLNIATQADLPCVSLYLPISP